MTGELPTLRLRPGEEDRVLSGHPWVFSNEIESIEGSGDPGSLAVAVSSRNQALGMGFYHPHSLIAWRLLSKRQETVDASFFQGRLEAALRLRRRLYPGLRSFRLCFGESDELPGLVVDKYEDVLVAQALSAGMDRRMDLIVEALRGLLQPKGIYLNNGHQARALEGLSRESRELFGEVPARVEIEEGGLKFLAPILEGQKTGFYFDQRDNRACAARHAEGRNVLDLYCYTGAFALAAAKAGAVKVLGLDSSAQAVELARHNARVNGLQSRAEFDSGDVEEVLRAFAGRGQPFEPDFILLDPPNLVPSKRHLMKALRAYGRINALALKCLPKGGLLATSSCSHHVSREALLDVLREAAAKSGRRLRLIETRTQAWDHPVILSMPETQYLHFILAGAD